MDGAGTIYEEFYGLSARPFQVAPDPKPLYWSKDHTGAYAALARGLVTRAPVAVLLGEAGTGKTTLVNRLFAELPEDVVGVRVSPALACRGEPVDWLLSAFAQTPNGGTPAERHARFRELVLDARNAGRRVLLVLDEAQALEADQLEELRLLAGFEEMEEPPLQMLLAGRPALRTRLALPDCAALAQRVAAEFRLRPLGAPETAEYIAWRLRSAGARETAFTDDAARVVYQATGGVPRLINVLCDRALSLGCAERSRRIGPPLLQRALEEATRRGSISPLAPMACAGLVAQG